MNTENEFEEKIIAIAISVWMSLAVFSIVFALNY